MENSIKKLPECRYYPDSVPEKWDNIEIESIQEDEDGNCEPVYGDEEISYYSVYLHNVEGGIQCIADFPTEPEALVFRDLLSRSVLNFKDNKYLTK